MGGSNCLEGSNPSLSVIGNHPGSRMTHAVITPVQFDSITRPLQEETFVVLPSAV